MIKFSKVFDNFESVIDELKEMEYQDDLFWYGDGDEFETYDSILLHLLSYATGELPSVTNIKYPNCISLMVNPFGFSYTMNNIGFGISTKTNRKSSEISYTLTFLFNKDKKLLKGNKVFEFVSDRDYKLIDTKAGK